MLTQEELRELLDYDPVTGVFAWRKRRGGRARDLTAGTTEADGYRSIRVNGRSYRAHRLAWLYVKGELPTQLDHINNVRDDNRIANLREATGSQNRGNSRQPRNSRAPYKGVRPHRKKWKAGIAGRWLPGIFDTPEAAFAAYCEAAQQRYGEFWRSQ